MVACEDEPDAFSERRDGLQPVAEAIKIEVRHGAGARVGMDQRSQGGSAVSDHARRGLQSQRGDAADRLVRMANVEHAGLRLVRDERLQHQAHAAIEGCQRGDKGRIVAHEANAGAVAANVRLERQTRGRHGTARALGVIDAGYQRGVGRDPLARRSSKLVENRRLAFAA